MANAARGLALGGAATAFRAADQRAVQREGIRSQERISAGAQTGQNERQQIKIAEEQRKSFVEETKSVVSGFIDQMNALTATLHPSLTQSERAKVIRKIETLERAIEQAATGLDAERGTGKARGANPVASLGDAASIRRQSFIARQAFVSRERQADAEGQALLAKAKGGGAEAKALEAGAVAGAKLDARAQAMQKIMQDAGFAPEAASSAAADPVATEAVQSPLAEGVASEDLGQVAQHFTLANAFFAAGMTSEAKFQLSQANFIMDNSPAIEREQELDKSISDSMAQILGMQPGVTYREARAALQASGAGIPSTAEVAEQRATGTALGKGRVKAQETIGFIGEARDIIGNLLQQVKADPGLVGISGSLRSTGQTAIDVLGDLGLNAFVETASDLAFENTELSLSEMTDLFSSPTLSVLGLMENSVGLILARLRTPQARIPVDVIKRSIKDVKLTGLTGSKQVVNRLEFVFNMLEKRSAGLQKRFGLGGTETPPSAQTTPNIPVFSITGGKLVPVQ